jgi:hypothetical protein
MNTVDNIFIKGTNVSPDIHIDKMAGFIEIKGNSDLEYPENFYNDLVDRIVDYMKNPQIVTIVNLRFTKINKSSSKWIYHLFQQINKLYTNKTTLVINWFCHENNEMIEEAGIDYQMIFRLPINLITEGSFMN